MEFKNRFKNKREIPMQNANIKMNEKNSELNLVKSVSTVDEFTISL